MQPRIIRTPLLMQPIAHFSHAQRVADTVYVGAIAGTDAQRRLAGLTPGLQDAAAQVRRMMENLRITLEQVGAGLADLARLKLYVNDAREAMLCKEAVQAELGAGGVPVALVISQGFPLPQASVELEARAEVGAIKEQVRTGMGAGVRCGERFFGFVECGGADFEVQLRDAVTQLLSHARLAVHDVVHLRVSVARAADIAGVDAAIGRIFAAPYPACSVVVAPLSQPQHRCLLELTAVQGRATPVHCRSVPNALANASTAMRAGDELFISAQAGTGEGEGVEAQARAAWARIRAVLAAAGMDARHVVQTTNVLTDWRHYGGFNAGYGANVAQPYPPRATLMGQLADPAALVQTEAIAHARALEATVVEAAHA